MAKHLIFSAAFMISPKNHLFQFLSALSALTVLSSHQKGYLACQKYH